MIFNLFLLANQGGVGDGIPSLWSCLKSQHYLCVTIVNWFLNWSAWISAQSCDYLKPCLSLSVSLSQTSNARRSFCLRTQAGGDSRIRSKRRMPMICYFWRGLRHVQCHFPVNKRSVNAIFVIFTLHLESLLFLQTASDDEFFFSLSLSFRSWRRLTGIERIRIMSILATALHIKQSRSFV